MEDFVAKVENEAISNGHKRLNMMIAALSSLRSIRSPLTCSQIYFVAF